MKHFIDIQNARFEDIDLGNDVIRKNNIGNFRPGDIISITEKIDGSCASFSYSNGEMIACSRKKKLDYKNTLNGFWNWVQTLNKDIFKNKEDYIFFGEWLQKHKILYLPENMRKFYCFAIWDKKNEIWLSQHTVKEFCKQTELTYVHEFYYGTFISWDHCKSFMDQPYYGDREEGICIKNDTTLNSPDLRNPFYLKIVNEDFKESMAQKTGKSVDPEKIKEREHALELMSQIVTKNRVEKSILKMIDEGLLPKEITPTDMKTISRYIPKRIYEDCVKEESEIVQASGEYAGKVCNQLAMQFAREIVIGN